MINWQYYPKSDNLPNHLSVVIDIFNSHENDIKSPQKKLSSNEVLSHLRKDLTAAGFKVEASKRAEGKIKVPVLFGRNGQLEKYFEADAYNKDNESILEVEAGRGVTNYQFLKDLFQACLMHNVSYFTVAIRNQYRTNPDFEKVIGFFDSLYASGRLELPLKGILIIGY